MTGGRRYFLIVATQIGLNDVGVLTYILRNIVCDLAAKIKRDHLVRNTHYEAHVMFDEQDRNLEVVPNLSNEFAERIQLFVIEPGGWLIEQQ